MSATKFTCAICGGIIKHEVISNTFTCSECNAEHHPDLFKINKSNPNKKRFPLKFNLFVAVIGSLYLLWLAYRLFMY